jgi:hypothetical protein
MLVEIRPFNGVPVAQQVPIATFLLGCLRQSWIPSDGNRQGSTVHEPPP